jgi:hypothetical protein
MKMSRCNSFGVAQSPEKPQAGQWLLYLKKFSCQGGASKKSPLPASRNGRGGGGEAMRRTSARRWEEAAPFKSISGRGGVLLL